MWKTVLATVSPVRLYLCISCEYRASIRRGSAHLSPFSPHPPSKRSPEGIQNKGRKNDGLGKKHRDRLQGQEVSRAQNPGNELPRDGDEPVRPMPEKGHLAPHVHDV